jgi:hypothetical protein
VPFHPWDWVGIEVYPVRQMISEEFNHPKPETHRQNSPELCQEIYFILGFLI